MTTHDHIAYMASAPLETLKIIIKEARERLIELADRTDCTDSATSMWIAAGSLEDAAALVSVAIDDELEHAGRQFNFERDQGARP